MKIFTDYYLHVLISLFIFTLSLYFPLIHYNMNEYSDLDYYHSLAFLLLGWMNVLIGYDLSWLANISYLFGLFFFMKPIKSCFLGILTLLLALSFLITEEKSIFPFAWGLVSITKYDTGFYLWIMSFFIFGFGQTWLAVLHLRNN